jgi:hypothetical protein
MIEVSGYSRSKAPRICDTCPTRGRLDWTGLELLPVAEPKARLPRRGQVARPSDLGGPNVTPAQHGCFR